MKGQSIKKAKEEDVEKLAKGLMVNHDRIQGGLSESDAAKAFVNGGDMEGIGFALNDVSALLPEEESDGPEEEAEEQDGQDDQEDSKKARREGKKKWFDRDREVNKAQRLMTTAVTKVQNNATTAKEQLEKTLSEVTALSATQQQALKGEKVIAEARLECLSKLWGTFNALQQHIRSIVLKANASSRSSTGTSSDPSKCLGLAAPCESFQKLVAFESLRKISDSVLDCLDLESIEKVKQESVDARAPISELISACKSAQGDLTKAMKAVREGPKKAKAAAKSAAQRTVAATAPSDIFKRALLCHEVPVIKEVDAELDRVNPDKPHLFETSDEHSVFEKQECVKRFMIGDFLAVFNTQGPAQKTERAHRRFDVGSEIRSVVSTRLQAIYGATCIDEGEEGQRSDELARSMEPMAVIVAKNTLTCSPEKSHSGGQGVL